MRWWIRTLASRLLGAPKSLLRLALLGFLVVAAPLVLALLVAAWSVDRLASEGQLAVYEAVGVTENSAHMARVVMDLERAAREYMTHRDPSALQEYRHWRRELASVSGPPDALGPETVGRLHRGLRVVESTLFTSLLLALDQAGEPVRRVPELSLALHRSVAGISAAGYQRIDEEVAEVQHFSERTRRIVFWHLVVAVPLTLAFTLYFARRIHRPFRALADSIRRLGTADFDQPVRITGPRDLEALGDELDHLRRQLAELQSQRQRFLRHLSHELKTPLSAVLEGAELLDDPQIAADPARRAELAGIVREKGHELRRQIDNLLRFARHGEATAAATELVRLDLAAVVREVAERHRLAAGRRRIEIRLELEPASVRGDRGQLATVVDNLLSNALRFSPEGSTVTVRLERLAEVAELQVLDQGAGLAEAERERVFEPFTQGQANGHGAIKGSGLGLSLVRDCLAGHDGAITAETNREGDGRGTCMRVRLPLAEQEAGNE